MISHLILYSTSHCHLCEEAIVLLDAATASLSTTPKFEYEIIDIINNDEHMHLYGLIIPVIYNPSTLESLNWPFSKEMIINFLESNKDNAQ